MKRGAPRIQPGGRESVRSGHGTADPVGSAVPGPYYQDESALS